MNNISFEIAGKFTIDLFIFSSRTIKLVVEFWLRQSSSFIVSWQYYMCITYLESIFETQPCDTRSCREMSHGLTPLCASSTILCRTTSGSGLPFTKTPPSWFTPPWPEIKTRGYNQFYSWKKIIKMAQKWIYFLYDFNLVFLVLFVKVTIVT